MADAVVLAGGHSPRELAPLSPYKACLTIDGRPIVHRVVQALLDAPSIDRVYILGNIDALAKIPLPDHTTLVQGADDIGETLRRALQLPRKDTPFLISAADTPLLTATAVEHFWQSAHNKQADLAYPIVRQEHMNTRSPHTHRTYVKLKDGTFTGGNLIYVGKNASEDILTFADRIFRARKRPWQLASLLGWSFCLSLLLGRLSIASIEQRLTHIWGRQCRALIMPYPELAIDVDKPSDYHIIKQHIEQTTR